MKEPVRILGSYLSPYVRKVLVALEEKGVPYQIDPVVPFFGDERFSAVSPLRRIPVLIDDEVTLCDSTVICEYLEERYPEPSLFPKGAAARAKARWLEEYADTRMGEVLIWRFFNQLVIRPFVWGEATDTAVVDKARNEEIPQILEYVEGHLPAEGFLFSPSAVSVADIAIAVFFRNAGFARFRPDAARFPRAAAFVERMLGRESFKRLAPFEDKCIRTPVAEHRAALAAMGAPLTAESFAAAKPTRGVMQI